MIQKLIKHQNILILLLLLLKDNITSDLVILEH